MIVFQSFYSSASSKSLSMVFWIDLSWQCDSDNVITTSVSSDHSAEHLFHQPLCDHAACLSVTLLQCCCNHNFWLLYSANDTTLLHILQLQTGKQKCAWWTLFLLYVNYVHAQAGLSQILWCLQQSDCVSQQYFELDHRHLQFSLWFCSLSPNITKIYNSDVCISRYLNCVQWIPMRWCILQVFKAVTGAK